jgi:hypothetical protein
MYASPKYNGEPTAQALATGMATLGRYGDDYMVHASEGETIVPGEIFEANPRLKQDLFRQMTMMGIEDPNRYVVGNSLNSLNPTTGQPEFFFKKIWKAAKKVLKVAAPVIAPILGNMIMPGLGGIIASALTTKLMGGSWGDALKSGVMSYAGGALAQGLGGALSGTDLGGGLGVAPGGTFMGGLTKGLAAPWGAAKGLIAGGAQNPLSQGIFGPRGMDVLPASMSGGPVGVAALKQSGSMSLLPSYQDPEALGRAGVIMTPSGQVAPTAQSVAQSLEGPQVGWPSSGGPQRSTGWYPSPGEQSAENLVAAWNAPPSEARMPLRTTPPMATGAPNLPDFGMESAPPDLGMEAATRYTQGITSAPLQAPLPMATGTSARPEFATKAYTQGINIARGEADKLVASGNLAETQRVAYIAARIEGNTTPIAAVLEATDVTSAARQAAAAPAAGAGAPAADVPWYGSKEVLGPAAAAAIPAGLAYALTDDPDDPEDEVKKLSSTDPRRIAYDQWVLLDNKNSPEALALRDTWYGKPKYDLADLQSKFGAAQLGAPRGIAAARGGEVVGRGTGTSDSIPARLSDGEFVMTADAVRNAGNGDRNLGAARMYDMMSRFERTG